jgi:TM2 domain-containing membrane protein YozV
MPDASGLPSHRMEQAPKWNPGTAAVLSLLLPGTGQIYAGKVLEGLLWMIAVVAAYHTNLFMGIFVHLACVFRAAKQNYPLPRAKTLIAVAALFLGLVTLGVIVNATGALRPSLSREQKEEIDSYLGKVALERSMTELGNLRPGPNVSRPEHWTVKQVGYRKFDLAFADLRTKALCKVRVAEVTCSAQ